ncbi:hypothetical protein VNI00_014189 [Paramarasmius palmivorus]|uniref:Uncharacterized protein n=1 Tax=Paramarasmius palmivorus TaxID=297713 RepID=A0AAW0BTZ8_9AGAR
MATRGDPNSTGVSATPNEQQTSSSISESSPRPALNTAQIAGITVGVSVVVFAILVTVCVITRRRKRKAPSAPNPLITPYRRVEPNLNVRGGNKQELGLPDHADQDRTPVRTERQVVYLDDSGWRPLQSRSDLEDGVVVMPPRYDAAV